MSEKQYRHRDHLCDDENCQRPHIDTRAGVVHGWPVLDRIPTESIWDLVIPPAE